MWPKDSFVSLRFSHIDNLLIFMFSVSTMLARIALTRLVDSSEWHRWHSSSRTMDWDNNSESMEMIKMIFSWESSPAITALRNCSRLDWDFQTWSQTPAGWSYSSGLDSCSLYEHLVSSWSSTLVSPSPSSRSWTPGPPSWCLRGRGKFMVN